MKLMENNIISIYAAGNSLAGSKHGDKIYTFKLGGTLPEGQVIDASLKLKTNRIEEKQQKVKQ